MKTNQMTYRQAMGELKTIVDRLRDGEDVDVDELVVDVAVPRNSSTSAERR